jgi:hypothetical protein
MTPTQYLLRQENLPYFMKDFHDQKDLFKAIYEKWKDGEPDHKVLEDINREDAQVFTIDFFLWWMGLHGYKLQKIKNKNIEFHDPIQTLRKYNGIRLSELKAFVKTQE